MYDSSVSERKAYLELVEKTLTNKKTDRNVI